MIMKQYRVTYYVEGPGLALIKRVTVSAPDPQTARDEAQRLDPKYIATIKTPREVSQP